jgi:hypothetical protein
MEKDKSNKPRAKKYGEKFAINATFDEVFQMIKKYRDAKLEKRKLASKINK